MTEEQKQYIKEWIDRNRFAGDESWWINNCNQDDIDNLWNIDEESYQMKKYLRNGIDVDNLSEELKSIYDEAVSLCSHIDEYSAIFLYATPEDWEYPNK